MRIHLRVEEEYVNEEGRFDGPKEEPGLRRHEISDSIRDEHYDFGKLT